MKITKTILLSAVIMTALGGVAAAGDVHWYWSSVASGCQPVAGASYTTSGGHMTGTVGTNSYFVCPVQNVVETCSLTTSGSANWLAVSGFANVSGGYAEAILIEVSRTTGVESQIGYAFASGASFAAAGGNTYHDLDFSQNWYYVELELIGHTHSAPSGQATAYEVELGCYDIIP